MTDGIAVRFDENNKKQLEVHSKPKRMVEQDIAKGICIFAVIFCHCVPVTQTVDIILRALLGYCMPVFFCLAGYNYKPNQDSYFRLVTKRARQLLIPLLKYSLVILVIFVIALLLYKGPDEAMNILKAYAGLWLTDPFASWLNLPTIGTYTGFQRIFEPYWFILYMFTAFLLFYAVADKALKNWKTMLSIIFIFVLITTVFNAFKIVLPWGLHNAPLFACLMLIGSFMKQKEILTKGLAKSWKNINFYVSAALVIASGFIFPRAGQITGSGQVNLVLGNIEPLYTLFYATLAVYFAVMLAGFVKKVKFIGTFFTWFGYNSMMIFMVHLIYVAIAKIIVGAELSGSLAYVTNMDIRDFIAFLIALILVSAHVIVSTKIGQLVKKRRDSKNAAKNALTR